MATKVIYEWCYETVDDFGDIIDSHHQDKLSDFTDADRTNQLCLVRNEWDGDLLQDRTWAYVKKNSELPDKFSDADSAPTHDVPAKFHKELHQYMNELVTVYHGTAHDLKISIIKHSGLAPKKGNKYVYVTTDLKVAINYSRAWAAWAMTNKDEIAKFVGRAPKPAGLVIKTEVRRFLLSVDPYNPEDEPNQYRVRGFLGLDDAEMEKIDFSKEFSEESKLNAAYCFWIGIGRATDN